MSDPYERIKASGIELPPCPRPAGSYAPGKVFGSLVFASGQTPTRDGVPAYRGRLGTDPGIHARTAIGVQLLPGGAPVEVELIASLRT